MQAGPVDTIPAVLPELNALRQQAERATAAADHASAVAAYTSALALLPDPLDTDVYDLAYDLLLARAACYRRLSDYSAAEADLVVLIDIARELHDPMREMEVIAEQVQVAFPQGKIAAMQPAVEAMLEQARTAGDALLEATVLVAQAEIRVQTSDFAHARSDAEAALVTFEAHDRRADAARMHWLLGVISMTTGDLVAGHTHAETALALYRTLGDRTGEANALNVMGSTSNDRAHQRNTYRQALAIFTELGNRERQGVVSSNLGAAYLALGLYDRAAAYFEHASILRDIQAHLNFAYVLQYLGLLALEWADADQAIAFSDQGRAYFQAAGNELLATICTFLIGRAALMQGELARAAELLEEAARSFATQEVPAERALALTWLGATALQRGDLTAARTATAKATALLEAGAESGDFALQEVWWWRWQVLTASETPSISSTSGEKISV